MTEKMNFMLKFKPFQSSNISASGAITELILNSCTKVD